MINLRRLDMFRLQNTGLKYGGETGDETCGAFEITSPVGPFFLRCIASAGFGWDHVSVSLAHRIPLWLEMEHVRRTFFKPEEAVMQYHAPLAEYVDGTFPGNCVTCLHLWRPHEMPIPKPYKWMVGGMSAEEANAAMKADGF